MLDEDDTKPAFSFRWKMLNQRRLTPHFRWRQSVLVALGVIIVLTMLACRFHFGGLLFHPIPILCPRRNSTVSYVTYVPRGGLGNRLFEYASAYGFSRHFGLRLAIRDANVERVFGSKLHALRIEDIEKPTDSGDTNTASSYSSPNSIYWLELYEAFGSAYDDNLVSNFEQLLRTAPTRYSCEERIGIRLHGYLQSFKYFEKYLPEIRDQFAFGMRQVDAASSFVEAVRSNNMTALTLLSNTKFEWDLNAIESSASGGKSNDLLMHNVSRTTEPVSNRARADRKVVVGVHIRRGDMVNNMQMVSAGYQTADYHYLLNATRYLRKKFAEDGASVRFFVSSNDVGWTQSFFPYRRYAVFSGADTPSGSPMRFAEHGAATMKDLLVLAHCDALILTVGSYGFWAATLGSQKLVTYYAQPFRSGSKLEATHNYTVSDYYPASWIGLS